MLQLQKLIISLFFFISSACIVGNIDQEGKLEIHTGSMTSGKSEALIRIATLHQRAHINIGVFKPLLDKRVLEDNTMDPSKFITSRSGSSIGCIAVENIEQMRKIILEHNMSTIAIDEAQFFDKEEIMTFVREMLALDKRIIISGLDLDFRGETFGAMGELAAFADHVTKYPAICSVCGKYTYCITQRLVNGEPAHYHDKQFQLGDQEYEARCRHCHRVKRD